MSSQIWCFLRMVWNMFCFGNFEIWWNFRNFVCELKHNQPTNYTDSTVTRWVAPLVRAARLKMAISLTIEWISWETNHFSFQGLLIIAKLYHIKFSKKKIMDLSALKCFKDGSSLVKTWSFSVISKPAGFGTFKSRSFSSHSCFEINGSQAFS